MDGLLTNKKIDVVDFDGLKLFMLKDDNLYDHFIANDRKNQDLDAYYKEIKERKGYPIPGITFENCESSDDPRNGLFIYFKHLLDQHIAFTVFDIGSHIGDFAIKCGHFFRNADRKIGVVSFDPSPAGMLVQYNIDINGLTKYNKHEALAVTEHDGYYIFHFREGYSDSAKLSFSKEGSFLEKLRFYAGSTLAFKFTILKKLISQAIRKTPKSFDLIVKGIKVENYLKTQSIDTHLFVKIDVEGYDEVLVREFIRLKKNKLISIISELHVDAGSIHFLQEISEHFYVFDLFYCPNPTRFKLISPEQFEDFIHRDLKNREYGYTDLFLLDKQTPDVNTLVSKLIKLRQKKDELIL
ncbi:MAG: FkbM family methyltransferase [Saprospiraceae bacterium]